MKWTRRKAQELRAEYQSIFGPDGGPAGQSVFLDLFDKCGMARTNFVRGDPEASAFNDGCRSIFLHILQMTFEPGEVPEVITETTKTEYID